MDNENVVYAIGPEASKRLKIGTSNNVLVRLRQIQNMSPVKLIIYWTTPGDELLEGALHGRFDARRTHGEWFDFDDVDDPIAEIDAAARVELERLAVAEENWSPAGADWKPECSVFEFKYKLGGAMLVMPPPTKGGWRCVALDGRRRRRCTRMMDDSALYGLPSDWMTWVIPGLGTVRGRRFRGPFGAELAEENNAKLRTLLSQVCRKHEGHHDCRPVAWRSFDAALDFEFIERIQYSADDYGLMPGMEYLRDVVEDFAESELFEADSLALPLAAIEEDESYDNNDDDVHPTGSPSTAREIVKEDMAGQYVRFFDIAFGRRRLARFM